MDIDFHPEDPEYEQKMAAVPEVVLAKKEELGLLMLERSVTKGYHVVFERRAELSQEENLKWASQLLGVKYDEGAKDITRVFFTTTDSPEDLLYLDARIFCQEGAPLKTTQEAAPLKTTKEAAPLNPPKGREEKPCAGHLPSGEDGRTPCDSCDSVTVKNSAVNPDLEYHGMKYSAIIDKYLELFNNGRQPSQGDRNSMTYELALALRPICNFDQQLMEQIIPQYDGFPEAEWRQTIANALSEPRKGMSWRLRQVLQAMAQSRRIEATGGTMSTPPPLPKRLPPLIQLLVSKVPDHYKPAVAAAVFPALAAHLHGVKFRYWDNVLHEATFMNVLIGRQSIGKGSIKQPIDLIIKSIKERDKPHRMREAEWKRQNPSGKQKAKDPRPEDICIQVLIDNLTDAVFNQRIVDADRNGQRYLYTIVDEIEALKKVTSKGTVDEVSLLIRKAFDNAEHGQERVGADSVSGIAPLRWNWNASTTPPNAKKFFTRAVNDGTVGRLDVSTIVVDKRDGESPDPTVGIYDDAFEAALKPYLDRLEAASGLIECPQANKLSRTMKGENEEQASLYGSEAYRVLSYRANVIAWLKGMLLYIADGYCWSRVTANFVRWSEQYNLWCKMLFFGDQLEAELREEEAIMQHRGPQNMLELLPQEFTEDEYLQVRSSLGKTGDGKATLRQWQSRGLIALDEVVGKFVKTRKYLDKNE